MIQIYHRLHLIILASAASSSDHASKNNEEHHDSDHHEYYHDHDVTSTSVSYKYVMNVHTTVLTDTSSQVDVNISKVVIENGTPTSSAGIESRATLTNFFQAVENDLAFVQKK